jgi:RNA polymerase sigma-70 factor (ECF subfamily)
VLELVPKVMTDEEIVSGLGRSDPQAARALYDSYGDLINRLVWRLLGGDPDHDDVVHQVFVNVLSSIDGLRNPAALGGWIRGVAINTVRREIRSRRYRRLLMLVPDAGQEAEEAAAPEESRLARSVYAILSRMGAQERIAFTLHHVEGLGLAEVAEIMGCSLATVKRRTAKARNIVMREMEKNAHLASILEEMKHEE